MGYGQAESAENGEGSMGDGLAESAREIVVVPVVFYQLVCILGEGEKIEKKCEIPSIILGCENNVQSSKNEPEMVIEPRGEGLLSLV